MSTDRRDSTDSTDRTDNADRRDTSDEGRGEKTARDIASKLDKTAEPMGGTSNMESHAQVGYTEEHVEERAQAAADDEGVTLYRNPDGSHTAVDETEARSDEAETEAGPETGSEADGEDRQ